MTHMRIQDLKGWPPPSFRTAEAPARDFLPAHPEKLRIKSATFVQGYRRVKSSGDLLLLLECPESGEFCTARLRVQDSDVGRHVEEALAICRGLTLPQAGNRLIPEDRAERIDRSGA